MKKIILILIISTITACNSNKTTKLGVKSKNDSTTNKIADKDRSLSPKTTNSVKPNQTDSSKILMGIWIPKGSDNPAFFIKRATIYYPDQFKSYKYKILGDSIKIKYDDFKAAFAYHVKNTDTLILNSSDYGESIYYRSKK